MQAMQKTKRAPLQARPQKVNDAEFQQIVNTVSDRFSKTLEYLAR